ncbi:MAG: hypothetical protein QF473_40120, partial [Planctomycetota bacterium]|nr:hypothetical protein [Planctomycetota bacterium]
MVAIVSGLALSLGCSSDAPPYQKAGSPLSPAAQSVKRSLVIRFSKYRFKEIAIQGGTGVLLN